MKSIGQVAASVAQYKEQHPELYCPAKPCLWRTGGGYCPRHRPAVQPENGAALVIERNQITARIVSEVGLGDTAGFIAHPLFPRLAELSFRLELAVRS